MRGVGESLLLCTNCLESFTHSGKARTGKDVIGFVNVGGKILRCPKCKRADKLKILKYYLGDESGE